MVDVRSEQHFADCASTAMLIEQRATAALRMSDWTHVVGGGRIELDGASAGLAIDPVFIESGLGGVGAHIPAD